MKLQNKKIFFASLPIFLNAATLQKLMKMLFKKKKTPFLAKIGKIVWQMAGAVRLAQDLENKSDLGGGERATARLVETAQW